MLRSTARLMLNMQHREYAHGSKTHLALLEKLSQQLAAYRKANEKLAEKFYLRKLINEFGESPFRVVKSNDATKNTHNAHVSKIDAVSDTFQSKRNIDLEKRDTLMRQALNTLDEIKIESADSARIHAVSRKR